LNETILPALDNKGRRYIVVVLGKIKIDVDKSWRWLDPRNIRTQSFMRLKRPPWNASVLGYGEGILISGYKLTTPQWLSLL